MNFITTVRKESKAYPGVFYTLNRMSEARRANLRLRIAEPTAQIRNLIREMNRIEENYPDLVTRPIEETQKLLDLSDKMEEISSQKIDPQWLLWGLKKLEGFEINDVEADGQMLIDDGPPILFDEIVEEIKRVAQLNGGEEKNSESLTISGERQDGTATNSSAASVENGDTSAGETAESIIQS